jgi:hypothetical protein
VEFENNVLEIERQKERIKSDLIYENILNSRIHMIDSLDPIFDANVECFLSKSIKTNPSAIDLSGENQFQEEEEVEMEISNTYEEEKSFHKHHQQINELENINYEGLLDQFEL